ncbi:glycosyltransferase [Xylanibacter muris]|uniref:Glycosyltransferase family 4 protein n=1 Tax=Xylanibacter muris TaxID=2736290 RepID=A0ABX2AIR6_9BACT|nr:glycosyltransferase [Xylanibacter muris]NPD90891.1 glycosyltransferase family 4 protein [Xylanibacter muris]
MKVGLHTVDLFPGRERLMPFRTVLEMAKVMKSQGWEADVLNSSVSCSDAADFEWLGIRVVQCPRDFGALSEWVNNNGYDVFLFAATIREGLRNLSAFQKMTCRKIAYIPSGITPKWNAFQLFRHYGLFAKAWMLEAVTPKTLIAYKLKQAGFTELITLTEYTSQRLGKVLPTHVIYPGKDEFEDIETDESILVKNNLKGERFYLFTGAPGQVRGSQLLLKAFDEFVESNKNLNPRIVFLMRNDVGAQYDLFFEVLNGMRHKKCVTVLREQLTIPQLKAFMKEAYAVVLPFICIPAEIPITYYEVMSCGTPVVSFSNAGTTEYLKNGLKIAGKVSVGNLTKALSELWNNKGERDVLACRALGIMEKHPTWNEVGKAWMDLIIMKNKQLYD